jgi:sigma-B regulation protein RsbU (phosphoserine phosphatase)
LLPSEPLRCERYQVDYRLTACEELAGDTLNYFVLDEHRVGFYVLDVVGHGVPAALMSVAISRLLSPRSGKSCLFESTGPDQKAARILSPAEVGRLLNEMFAENIGSGQFFTIFYGIWNTADNELTYFSAGHPEAVFLPASGTPRLLEATGFPVGVSPDPGYSNQTFKFGRGDRLFVYSDGLTEAMNENKEQFGVDGLTAIAEKYRTRSLKTCLDAIMRGARCFRLAAPVKDDLSLLAFEATA